jgi:cephalosporin-C deacetylase-like acetyl esterase
MPSPWLRAAAIVCCAVFVFADLPRTPAQEADRFDLLDAEIGGVTRDKLLENYLIEQLRPHFAARRAEVAAITTPEEFYARQEKVRELLFKINGKFPERTPLNPQTTGKIQRDGYTIEKVIYESRPGHHITANLYLPDNRTGKVPGVLVPCGHSTNGKGSAAYQSISISLAQHGMAALCYDPIGQGERHQLLDPLGKPSAPGTTEHTLTGVGGWLVGQGTANYRIWDGIRSIDYLVSRPEIDAERIGCTGNSGGGTLTSYLMAFDPRILAAAPSCYLTTLERLFDTIGPQDAEQNFPGQVALGIDHPDYVALRAPKPTLICVATRDYFDIDGAWQNFRENKLIYGTLGHGERVDLFEYNDTHGFSLPRRQAAMRFLRRWLLEKDDNPDEREMQISTDEELQCTRTGEVLADFPDGVSVFDLNAQKSGQLAQMRASQFASRTNDELLATVRQVAAIGDLGGQVPQVRTLGTVLIEADSEFGWDGSMQKLVLTRKGDVPVPAMLFRPKTAQTGVHPAVIYVSSEGKSADATGAVSKLAADGKLVLSLDLRGYGETAGNVRRARGGYFGTDFKTALLALHLNRPLLGQRVEDVLSALNYLASRDDVDGSRIELVGVGGCGPVALHAAALDDRIAQVTLRRSIDSWAEVASTPLARDQLTNVIPFVLEHYDLPDLVKAIEPRKVIIQDRVDPTGKPKE